MLGFVDLENTWLRSAWQRENNNSIQPLEEKAASQSEHMAQKPE
jgi:hypothetical protein